MTDRLPATLGANARRNLREGVPVAREHALASEALRALLLLRGFPMPDPVIRLEESVGGTVLPVRRMLGAGALLKAAPWLRPTDLPRHGPEPLLPVCGDPEQLVEDWEGVFLVMDGAGAIAVYDSPAPPAPLYDSLEHLLEVEALAPFSSDVRVHFVEGLRGELVAGLAGALLHPAGCGAHVTCFAGDGVWVKELRTGLRGFHGTFLLSTDAGLVREVEGLLAR